MSNCTKIINISKRHGYFKASVPFVGCLLNQYNWRVQKKNKNYILYNSKKTFVLLTVIINK